MERNVRCMMFSTRIPSCANAATAAFEIDTAERRAERLWQLSDAEKPALGERPDTGLVQVSCICAEYNSVSDRNDCMLLLHARRNRLYLSKLSKY